LPRSVSADGRNIDCCNKNGIIGIHVFRVGTRRLQAMFDLYNRFYANPALTENTRYSGDGATCLRPLSILNGRLLKFGAQFDF